MSLDLLNDLIKGEAPKATAQAPVADVSEIDRILALPRRAPPSMEEQTEMARAMTARLRYDPPGGKCACALLRPEVVARGQNPCITELRPIQGWYLTEAANNVGVLGAIAVGGGKTGIDILTPMVVEGCDLAVLLIPSNASSRFPIASAEESCHRSSSFSFCSARCCLIMAATLPSRPAISPSLKLSWIESNILNLDIFRLGAHGYTGNALHALPVLTRSGEEFYLLQLGR